MNRSRIFTVLFATSFAWTAVSGLTHNPIAAGVGLTGAFASDWAARTIEKHTSKVTT